MASLLGVVSELIDSACDVGQKISMNHALQYVDVSLCEKLALVTGVDRFW
jgi:hypothetical protein